MSRAPRRRPRGQAIVEMSLILPVLLVLLGGAGQIGAITYAQMTVESAAMQGARVASESPNKSLDFVPTLLLSSYVCGQSPADAQVEQSVCDAVRSSTGLLGAAGFSITVSVVAAISLGPSDIRLVKKGSCASGVQETGTVGSLPPGVVATVSSPSRANAGTVTTSSLGAYSICLSTPSLGQGDQTTTITATATDGSGCVYGASTTVTITTSGTVAPAPADMTLGAAACPTLPPTPTPPPAPTPTPAPTLPPLPGLLPTPPPIATCTSTVPDTEWLTVTVTYRVPIFVPFLNRILADTPGGSVRTVSAAERIQIEPCLANQGG